MSLQKLIEKIKSDAEYPHVFNPGEVLKLCEAAEVLYAKHKEIYADGSYKDIASELASEAMSKADKVCED